MTVPTSLRLPPTVKDRLARLAAGRNESTSATAVRLLDEGSRMAEHPGVTFHDSAAHGRVACLVDGPDIAEVVEVLAGLEAQGEERVAEAARWLDLPIPRVRAAVGYYAAFADEVDQQLRRRHAAAAEARARYEVERTLLG